MKKNASQDDAEENKTFTTKKKTSEPVRFSADVLEAESAALDEGDNEEEEEED